MADATYSTNQSALHTALKDALLDGAYGFNAGFVNHLCQQVRQIIADELQRAAPSEASIHDRGKGGSIQYAHGFATGWDAARDEVLMPTA